MLQAGGDGLRVKHHQWYMHHWLKNTLLRYLPYLFALEIANTMLKNIEINKIIIVKIKQQTNQGSSKGAPNLSFSSGQDIFN